MIMKIEGLIDVDEEMLENLYAGDTRTKYQIIADEIQSFYETDQVYLSKIIILEVKDANQS